MKQVAYRKMDDLHRVYLGQFPGYEPMECVSFFGLGEDGYKLVLGDQPGALYRRRLDGKNKVVLPKDLLLNMGVPKKLLAPLAKAKPDKDKWGLLSPLGQAPSADGLEETLQYLYGPSQEPYFEEPEDEEPETLVFKLLYDWDTREIELYYQFVDIGLGVPLSLAGVKKLLDCIKVFSPSIANEGLNDWYAGLVRYLQTISRAVME